MVKDNIAARGVDMDVFLEVKSIAARRRKKMGDIITEALELWLEKYKESTEKQQNLG